MIIYLAGPITGSDGYEEKFAEAEAHLVELGHEVLNPARLPKGLGSCDVYMRICLPMIEVADAVVLLEGWQDSRGACREWGYAMALQKMVVAYENYEVGEVDG